MRNRVRVPVFSVLCGLGLAVAGCGGEAPPPAAHADPESQRALRQGEVVGATGAYGAHVWRGLPFAAPPVGERRWRAPEPPAPWSGTRQALADGSACPQFATPMGGKDDVEPGTPLGSEDCLFLNVFAPRMTPSEAAASRRPLMLWIHGGGNTIGSADFYDGGHLAQEHGVVVVATQYRLGPLGWFRHPALHGPEASAADRSGNYGTLDLIAALRWVRDNAAAFGGDPHNVTIFGESAGGANVYSLLFSPLAGGLFQRAIVQSGSLRSRSVAQAEGSPDPSGRGVAASSREAIERLLVAAGQAPGAEAAVARVAAARPGELAGFLRGLGDRQVLAAYSDGGLGMIDMPNLFRDGHVLPEQSPVELLAAGRYHRVPVILGSNRDENKLFMAFDDDHMLALFGLPVWLKDDLRYQREAGYRSRMWKAAAVDQPADAIRAAHPAVFAYRFDWDELPQYLWVDLGSWLGAAHAFEIPFVFGHFNLGRMARMLWTRDGVESRAALSASMMSYWAQFAETGDPGAGRDGSQPRWAAWDPAGAKFLVLDTPEGGGIRMSADAITVEQLVAELARDASFADDRERCALIASLVDRTPQLLPERLARVPGCGAPVGG